MPKQEKPLSQVEVVGAIVAELGMDDSPSSKRLVKNILAAVSTVAVKQLRMRGIGKVTIPGLNIKMELIRKPAVKAHPGRNPFTGEEITVAAKPARNVVKIKAMKKLKDSVL